MDHPHEPGEVWVCGGCGVTAPAHADGWRSTDAKWCPECAWLA